MALEELNDYTTLSRFTGLNPIRWLFEVERFFFSYAIYEEERFPYVVEYFDDEPFSWFNSWCRGPERLTWNSFAAAMLTTFPSVPNPPPNHMPSPEPFAPPPPPQPTRQTYTTNLPEPKQPPKPQPLIALFSPTSPITTPPPCTKPVTPPSTNVPKLNHNAAVRLQWRPPWQPVKTEKTMAQVLTASASHTAQIGAISKHLTTITTTTPNRVTTIIKTDTKVTAQTSHSPSTTTCKLSNMLTKNFSVHPSALAQTFDDVMVIMDKLAANGVSLSLSIFIKLCFCWPKIFPPDHQCPPPKFVFLESKHEPPWKLFTLYYGNLGLEDKAVFQDGSIDTCTKDQEATCSLYRLKTWS